MFIGDSYGAMFADFQATQGCGSAVPTLSVPGLRRYGFAGCACGGFRPRLVSACQYARSVSSGSWPR